MVATKRECPRGARGGGQAAHLVQLVLVGRHIVLDSVRVVVGIIITGFPEAHHRGVDVIIRRVGNRVIAFETTVMNEVDDAPQVAVRRAHDSRSARTFHRDDRRGGKKSCVSGKDRRRSKRSSHPLHTEERRRRDVVRGGGQGCSNPIAPSISAPPCAHLHRSRAEQPRPRRQGGRLPETNIMTQTVVTDVDFLLRSQEGGRKK